MVALLLRAQLVMRAPAIDALFTVATSFVAAILKVVRKRSMSFDMLAFDIMAKTKPIV